MSDYPVIAINRIWDAGERSERVNCRFGGQWRVSDLRDLVKNEPVFDLPLAHIDLGNHDFGVKEGLIGFARHMKHVMEADLSFPIILDEWGMPLDGRHRLVKALIEGHETIKAVRVPAGSSPTIPEN